MEKNIIKILFTLLIVINGVIYTVGQDDKIPLNKTDVICNKCSCKDATIDCSKVDLSTFFTLEDWAGVTDRKPETVNLSYNSFTEVTKFPEITLTKLDLSHGAINKIVDMAFRYLQTMKELDLSYNNLTSAALRPNVFSGIYEPEKYLPLEALRVLRLSYNDLHSLNQDLFEHITELTDLYLNGNPFTVIDHATVISISTIQNLKILDMSNCMLKMLPEYFLHTPRYLERLDLSSNQFINIPEPLQEVHTLKYLSLSNNPIKYIEKNSTIFTAFPKMETLEELHICNMPLLEEIKEQSMIGLIGLKILHMSNNSALSKIDELAFRSDDPVGEGYIWPPIKELYLQHNNLTMIESGLLGRWDYLTHIDMRHNPYLCDCSTQWMVNTLASIVLTTSPTVTSDIICHEPIEMRGKSLVHLEEIHTHMRCSDIYGNRPEKDAAMLIGTLIGVLISVPIILGIILLIQKGYCGICRSTNPAAFSRTFYKRTGDGDDLF